MKNIIDICKDFGIEIPADKHADFLKAVNGEYKTIAEHGKVLDKLSAATKRAETAEEALKGFEGIDPTKVNEQLAEANRKVKEAQEAAQKQIAERDLKDKLTARMTDADIREDMHDYIYQELINSGVSLNKNGDLIGFDEGLKGLKEKRPSAFIDRKQEDLEKGRARFTAPNGGGGNTGGTTTLKDIMKIKDPVERQRTIGQNMHLFGKGE